MRQAGARGDDGRMTREIGAEELPNQMGRLLSCPPPTQPHGHGIEIVVHLASFRFRFPR